MNPWATGMKYQHRNHYTTAALFLTCFTILVNMIQPNYHWWFLAEKSTRNLGGVIEHRDSRESYDFSVRNRWEITWDRLHRRFLIWPEKSQIIWKIGVKSGLWRYKLLVSKVIEYFQAVSGNFQGSFRKLGKLNLIIPQPIEFPEFPENFGNSEKTKLERNQK